MQIVCIHNALPPQVGFAFVANFPTIIPTISMESFLLENSDTTGNFSHEFSPNTSIF